MGRGNAKAPPSSTRLSSWLSYGRAAHPAREMSPEELRAYAAYLRRVAAELEDNKTEKSSASNLRMHAAMLRSAAQSTGAYTAAAAEKDHPQKSIQALIADLEAFIVKFADASAVRLVGFDNVAISLCRKIIEEIELQPLHAREQLLRGFRDVVLRPSFLPYLQKSAKLVIKILNAFARLREAELQASMAKRLVSAWEYGSFPLYLHWGKGPPPDAHAAAPAWHFEVHRAHQDAATGMHGEKKHVKPDEGLPPSLHQASPHSNPTQRPRAWYKVRTHGHHGCVDSRDAPLQEDTSHDPPQTSLRSSTRLSCSSMSWRQQTQLKSTTLTTTRRAGSRLPIGSCG